MLYLSFRNYKNYRAKGKKVEKKKTIKKFSPLCILWTSRKFFIWWKPVIFIDLFFLINKNYLIFLKRQK